jgi:hypothetical protein
LASGFIANKENGLIKGNGLFYCAIDMGDLISGYVVHINHSLFGMLKRL